MSKQKSYVITDAADAMAAELAEANGLSKSNVIEILIRQAHANNWAVAANESSIAQPITAPIPLTSLLFSARTMNALALASKPGPNADEQWIDADLTTLQDVARLGVWLLKKQRNFGRKGMEEVGQMCENHGIQMRP